MTKHSIIHEDSCRGNDASKIWEAIMYGEPTIAKVCIAINRGTKYTHDLLKVLESEGRIVLSLHKRVRDRRITIKDRTK